MNRRLMLLSAVILMIFSRHFSGFSQDIEPSEPSIVLPAVVLEIEDLSIESITAVLPEDEEILPPEIEFPLPEVGELEVEEPHMDFTMPQTGVPAFQIREGKYLTTEAVLGIGTTNQFFSRISLYYLGKKPEGKILYQHEALDGFSSKPAGSGYGMREDRLEGSLSFDLGSAEIRTEGAYRELERGLQGNGNFYSKINRFVGVGGQAEYQIGDRFLLKGYIDTSVAAQLITGGSSASEEVTEVYISPKIAGELRFSRLVLGIEPRFSYRNVFDNEDLSLMRGGLSGYFEADISDKYRLNGSLGWYWIENLGHLVPFNLALTVTPTEFFSFTAGGGYRIEEFNLKDIFNDYPLAGVPASLYDNHGWFAELRSGWIPFQGWMFDAGLLYTDNKKMPSPGDLPGTTTTGLFPLTQIKAQRLSMDTGVRWNISESFSARFGLESEFLKKPEFYPGNRATLEVNGIEKKGRYGGGFSSEFLTGVNDSVQLPVLDLNGFFRATDFLRFVLEIDDLLYPLLDGRRYYWEPYIEPGLKVILKAHINF